MSSGDLLEYQDTVTFVITTLDTSNGYADQTVTGQQDVPAIVELNTGYIHQGGQDIVTSDARIYVDPTNAFISDNYYRLEEMNVVIDLFDTPEARGWYRVETATVNRDHLLGNDIDNVELRLKKTADLGTVS